MSTTPAAQPRSSIARFFYQEEVPYGMALVRIVMPLVLLIVVAQRWGFARELYSADGATAPLAAAYGYPDLLPVLSGAVVAGLYAAHVFFLLTSSLGWCSRLSLAISTVLYTYFNMLDCIGTMTKYSVIASHVLLLLSVSRCGTVWSVDAWLQGRRRNAWPGLPSRERPRSSAWPRRLMQLMIAIVYFGSAITKMHTPAFFSGDQMLFWMLTNVNFDHPLGDYFAQFPSMLVIAAYFTIVWEVVFLFLAWKGVGRMACLAMGVMFHILTALTLGLLIFPLVCLTIYFAFLDENDVRRMSQLARRWGRRLQLSRRLEQLRARLPRVEEPQRLRRPALVAFAMLALASVAGGIEVEYRMDLYGERRPEGRHQLRELSSADVDRMLGPAQPLRPQDKFFAFDCGTVLVGGILANRRSEFVHGEQVIAQCHLNPPHEDMWIECNLHDAQNHMIERLGQIAPREVMRSDFLYMLNESFEPGDYWLVLKAAGTEITRRKIVLRSHSTAPLAN